MNFKKEPKILKIISINLFLILIGPFFLLSFSRIIRNFIFSVNNKTLDKRIESDALENKELANQIFIETEKLSNEYIPFIGWRPKLNNSNILKLNKTYKTRSSLGENLNNSTWFFGGSTVWGFINSQYETIPSIYHLKTKKLVFNFGELGWTSRQSLNQFLNVISDGYLPDNVIFYEGINDIGVGCSIVPGIDFASSANELKIKKAIQNNGIILNWRIVIKSLFEPYEKVFNAFKKDISETRTRYDCHLNKYKAKKVAKNLINNWYAAYLISKSIGSNFIAILQPTLITSSVRDFIDLDLKGKYDLVETIQYPTLIPYIEDEIKMACKIDPLFCENIYNGTSWLLSKEEVFIDTNHINGTGNEIIVEKIISIEKN